MKANSTLLSTQKFWNAAKALGLTVALVGGVSYLVYKRVLKNKEPLTISEINVYPVKALRGMSVKEWKIGERGLVYDRNWMVVTQNVANTTDAQYKFITQRQYPRMCKIGAKVDLDDLTLTLYSVDDESDQFVLSFKEEEQKNNRVTAEIWNAAFESLDMGDEIAKWLSSHLSKEVRLVMVPQDMQRQPNEIVYKDITVESTDESLALNTGFADGFPHLVVTENSLADVNKRLAKPVEMNRFRPNITVRYNSGLKAFEEEYWKHIEIIPVAQETNSEGNVQLYHVKICTRCSVPNVNPDTAEREEKGPSYQLNQYHTANNKEDNPVFGLNAMHTLQSISKTIRVGDRIVVHSKHSTPPSFVE